MKKILMALSLVAVVALAGCSKKDEPKIPAVPTTNAVPAAP